MLVREPQLPRTPQKAHAHANGGGGGGNGGSGRRTSPANGNGSRGGRGGGRRSRTPPNNNNTANANHAAKGPQQQQQQQPQHHNQHKQQNGASRQKPGSPRATISPASTTNVAHISNGAANRQHSSLTPSAFNHSELPNSATGKASAIAPHAAPAAQPAGSGAAAVAGQQQQRRQTPPSLITTAYQRPILPASPPRPLTVPPVPPAHHFVKPQAEVPKSRVNLASRWNIDPKAKPKATTDTPAHTGPPPFNYQEVVDYMNKAATRPDILEKILAFEKVGA
ncbi:hypothetical protein HDU87_003742 [Geranomyces variabilis]|uniref:Uncharacterized protein n=1 Tax=Geranomyces variabilis TaxID=109894 RepID=A0AAD5TLJ2_9FUNG|nr:hypothetical protein HDU87_003742 [Geranomyces variabilis]